MAVEAGEESELRFLFTQHIGAVADEAAIADYDLVNGEAAKMQGNRISKQAE